MIPEFCEENAGFKLKRVTLLIAFCLFILQVGFTGPGSRPNIIFIMADDLAYVAYWSQQEPHIPFPCLPSKKKLIINIENPNPMKQ